MFSCGGQLYSFTFFIYTSHKLSSIYCHTLVIISSSFSRVHFPTVSCCFIISTRGGQLYYWKYTLTNAVLITRFITKKFLILFCWDFHHHCRNVHIFIDVLHRVIIHHKLNFNSLFKFLTIHIKLKLLDYRDAIVLSIRIITHCQNVHIFFRLQ